MHVAGYKSKKVALSTSPVEVVSSGTVMSHLVFVNEAGAAATISGSGLSAGDTQEFVVEVPANSTIALPDAVFVEQGMQFSGAAGTSISFRYGTSR